MFIFCSCHLSWYRIAKNFPFPKNSTSNNISLIFQIKRLITSSKSENDQRTSKQECIPVGCVLPTAVAAGGYASVHAGIHTPWVWASRSPLGVGLETPLARPLNFPPGCGPGNLQGMLGYPPGDLLQGMLGYHPPPPIHPVESMTDTCKNIRLRAVKNQRVNDKYQRKFSLSLGVNGLILCCCRFLLPVLLLLSLLLFICCENCPSGGQNVNQFDSITFVFK